MQITPKQAVTSLIGTDTFWIGFNTSLFYLLCDFYFFSSKFLIDRQFTVCFVCSLNLILKERDIARERERRQVMPKVGEFCAHHCGLILASQAPPLPLILDLAENESGK